MLRACVGFVALIGWWVLTAVAAPAPEPDRHWPQWRGPNATGVAPHADPPVTWSEDDNVLFKVEIPGRGHASPVVWGDEVFLLTAVPTGKEAQVAEGAEAPAFGRGVTPDEVLRFVVMALDRETGEVLWQKTAVEEAPHEGHHPDGTWASASAVTDGEHLIAHFGSRGIFAYDLAGDLKWSKDLGDMQTRHGFGEGSSPVIHGNVVVVNWDHQGDSFVVALDKTSGEELWRKSRDEVTSWATPLVVEHGGKAQVIVSATERIRGYDLATGSELWQAGGMTVNTIPSPVHRDGIVYAMSGFRGTALRAIRLAQAQGDVTGTEAIAWTYDKDTPYVPSPLLYGDLLYFLKHNQGILSCLDADTGEVKFGPVRLDGVSGVYASPVGAAGRVYIPGRDGTTVVLEHGPEFKVLATNELDEGFDASPAVVGDTLYLRGRRHLYALRDMPSPKPQTGSDEDG